MSFLRDCRGPRVFSCEYRNAALDAMESPGRSWSSERERDVIPDRPVRRGGPSVIDACSAGFPDPDATLNQVQPSRKAAIGTAALIGTALEPPPHLA